MSIQGEPVFGGCYGDSGTGKTADALFAFPDAEILCPKGSTKSTRNLHGFEARVFYVKTLDDCMNRVKWWKTQKTRPSALIADDVSLQQQAQLMLVKGKNFETWRVILEKILELAMFVRELDCHFWMTLHEMQPRTFSGQWYRGGPLLAGAASQHLPKSMDVLLRVMPEEKRPMWPFVYQCNNIDRDYVTKDRTNTCSDHVPMNIGEILRCAGYVIPRKKGLEWQEGYTQKICDALLKLDAGNEKGRRAIVEKAFAQLSAKSILDTHATWCIRDAVDRAVLIRTSNSPKRRMLSTFK